MPFETCATAIFGAKRFRKSGVEEVLEPWWFILSDIKVSALDTGGGLCVTEVTSLHKGGPVRHLHHEQDEWFYVLEGEHVIEVGEERYELGAGDSLIGPREVAHAWAHEG